MPIPKRGEVWLVDFGLAGKARPALIVSVGYADRDRALITVVPHTTALRGSSFEVAVQVHFLKPGAFLVQGVTTFPSVKALPQAWLSRGGSPSKGDGGTLALARCRMKVQPFELRGSIRTTEQGGRAAARPRWKNCAAFNLQLVTWILRGW